MIVPINIKQTPPRMQALIAVAVVVLLFILQTALAKLSIRIADLFHYRSIDPYGAFAWISVHHFAQGLLALLLMAVLYLLFGLQFKLGLGNWRLGIRLVLVITLGLLLYQLIISFILILLGQFKAFPYPADTTNVLGVIGFQLLLSGTSEELLFRAFPITLLSLIMSRTFVLFRGKVVIPYTVLLSSVLFSIAHINWTLSPFSIHMDWMQVAYAFALGMLQGWVYVKTNSVVYSMFIHSISNVFVVGLSILLPMVLNVG